MSQLKSIFALLCLSGSLLLGCGEDSPADTDADTSTSDSTPLDTSDALHTDEDSADDTDEDSDLAQDAQPDVATVHPDPLLPGLNGPCPEMVDGMVTFAPDGMPARDVRLFVGSDPQAQDGPLIFYWHGTYSSPNEALSGLGDIINDVVSSGGMVAAPTSDPDAGAWPWHLTDGQGPLDDMVLADQVLACANEQIGIDPTRIHSIGMSAGGLQTTQMAYLRSNYIASVVTYSGGIVSLFGAPGFQNKDNLFSAMIFHGGPQDVVIIGFEEASIGFWNDLDSTGRFGIICNHGRGHRIPNDAQAAVGAFFDAHPWGRTPSPWETLIPSSLPSYCAFSP